ncbi:unnamed protein product [Rotaria sp. Silwood2]|nr:unnamed protein product [Rotaria sp. Silwood2]CAF3850538.1 unnamed protein product [Rotaria sp. Silwood2]CAF4035388.1 unnamed protein product [Rotaria sp. Silwood2]
MSVPSRGQIILLTVMLTDSYGLSTLTYCASADASQYPFEKASKEQQSSYPLDGNHLDKGFVPIARWRPKSTKHDNKKPECLWINPIDSYSTLFEATNYVDSVKNVLPCNEDETANFSKYEYELNYNEEHLFRC